MLHLSAPVEIIHSNTSREERQGSEVSSHY